MPLSTKTAIVTLLALGVSVIAVKPWPKWDDKSFVLKVSGLASGEENPGYNYCGKENDCSYPRQVPKNAKCTHCSNFGHDMNDHMQYFEFITGKSIMGGDKDLMVEFYKDAGCKNLLSPQYLGNNIRSTHPTPYNPEFLLPLKLKETSSFRVCVAE